MLGRHTQGGGKLLVRRLNGLRRVQDRDGRTGYGKRLKRVGNKQQRTNGKRWGATERRVGHGKRPKTVYTKPKRKKTWSKVVAFGCPEHLMGPDYRPKSSAHSAFATTRLKNPAPIDGHQFQQVFWFRSRFYGLPPFHGSRHSAVEFPQKSSCAVSTDETID